MKRLNFRGLSHILKFMYIEYNGVRVQMYSFIYIDVLGIDLNARNIAGNRIQKVNISIR